MSKKLDLRKPDDDALAEARTILLRDERGTRACVVEGTRVLLKDGLEKAIEEINPWEPGGVTGDVLISIEGTAVYPVAMIAGPEEHFPIVKIEASTDSRRYSIGVSKWHSFLQTPFSMVQAYGLLPGDRLITDTGVATVETVEYEEYDGEVWNVFLASEEFKNNLDDMTLEMIYAFRRNSLLGLRPKEQLIITDGFVSGSFVIQIQLIEHFRKGISLTEFV